MGFLMHISFSLACMPEIWTVFSICIELSVVAYEEKQVKSEDGGKVC